MLPLIFSAESQDFIVAGGVIYCVGYILTECGIMHKTWMVIREYPTWYGGDIGGYCLHIYLESIGIIVFQIWRIVAFIIDEENRNLLNFAEGVYWSGILSEICVVMKYLCRLKAAGCKSPYIK